MIENDSNDHMCPLPGRCRFCRVQLMDTTSIELPMPREDAEDHTEDLDSVWIDLGGEGGGT